MCGADTYSHQSMFDSVSKITQVIRRCKMEPEKVNWGFVMMLDRVQEGYMTISDMSINSLMGNRERKGHIDVLLCIQELNDKLIFEEAPSLGLDPKKVSALPANFNSVSAYRNKVPPEGPDHKGPRPRRPCVAAWVVCGREEADSVH